MPSNFSYDINKLTLQEVDELTMELQKLIDELILLTGTYNWSKKEERLAKMILTYGHLTGKWADVFSLAYLFGKYADKMEGKCVERKSGGQG